MSGGLVLSFLRRPSDTNDWSKQELAEFYRVEAALLQAGLSITTDRGISDEGDPWFVFCRADNEEVIAHLARVDREYTIVSNLHSGVARGRDFRLLIRQMIEANPLMLPMRRTHGQKIFLHPAALLTALLASAYFLASEKEFGGNSPSDSAKNPSIVSSLTQKFGALAAVGLALVWLEHQGETAYKFVENAFQGMPLSDDTGSTHVIGSAPDADAAFDAAILQAIRNFDSGAHRIDATAAAIPQQEENETNAISKTAMQVGAQAGGPDDGNATPSSVPNLSAIGDHIAPDHLDGTQNEIDNAPFYNNVLTNPAREPVAALPATNQSNESSTQPSSPNGSVVTTSETVNGSVVTTSEAVIQLAVSGTSNPSIQPVVLSNGAVPLNMALQQVAVQVGFDTDALHSQSTIDASQVSSSAVSDSSTTTTTLTPLETQILHTIEKFIQNTSSFEVAVSGSNVLIVDTNAADAKSADFGVLTWDLSNGSTLSIVGIIPLHHAHGVVTAA